MRWEQIKQLNEEDQINAINDLMLNYPDLSIAKIETEILNITKGIISNTMKRKGYKLYNDGLVREYQKNNNNTTVTQVNTNNNNNITPTISNNTPTTTNSMDSITFLYMTINKYLQNQKLGNKNIPTTMKITPDNYKRISKFLTSHPILNKQDVVNLAIEMFLDKFE